MLREEDDFGGRDFLLDLGGPFQLGAILSQLDDLEPVFWGLARF